MKKKINFVLLLLLFLVLASSAFSQGPGEPYHPMTANGARHIHYINNQYFAHKLFWENPANTIYNEIYISQDSNLVLTLDPTALILSGQDSSRVFNVISLELLGDLDIHTKYYWRIVEYNSSGLTAGPVWYFITATWGSFWADNFDDDLSNYVIQPPGEYWFISYSSYAGGTMPELMYINTTSIVNSYLILDEFFDLSPYINPLNFTYSVDFISGVFTVGFAYSLDEGITWIPFWQQVVTENIPPTQIYSAPIPNENYVKIALFYSSTSPSSNGFFYLDNLILDTFLTIPTPPAQIQALADSLSLKVFLNWSPGWAVDPITGYRIQRKNGIPTSSSIYQTITEVGPNILSFDDVNVQLDGVYTYRIQTIFGPGGVTTWSNEATAYVPDIVPVELQSFTSEVIESDVQLLWSTATETNNEGFEIHKKELGAGSQESEWMEIGFVPGHGTTTEIQHYSFADNDVKPGTYQYKLKQIDFDGSIEFSNIIEVTIDAPLKFSLEQNYPNPFNPTTKIKYEIPGQARNDNTIVTLKVYDVLGNEVVTLINENKSAGTYEVEFDGTGLPSGIYFYQLKAGNTSTSSGQGFIETKKMILLR